MMEPLVLKKYSFERHFEFLLTLFISVAGFLASYYFSGWGIGTFVFLILFTFEFREYANKIVEYFTEPIRLTIYETQSIFHYFRREERVPNTSLKLYFEKDGVLTTFRQLKSVEDGANKQYCIDSGWSDFEKLKEISKKDILPFEKNMVNAEYHRYVIFLRELYLNYRNKWYSLYTSDFARWGINLITIFVLLSGTMLILHLNGLLGILAIIALFVFFSLAHETDKRYPLKQKHIAANIPVTRKHFRPVFRKRSLFTLWIFYPILITIYVTFFLFIAYLILLKSGLLPVLDPMDELLIFTLTVLLVTTMIAVQWLLKESIKLRFSGDRVAVEKWYDKNEYSLTDIRFVQGPQDKGLAPFNLNNLLILDSKEKIIAYVDSDWRDQIILLKYLNESNLYSVSLLPINRKQEEKLDNRLLIQASVVLFTVLCMLYALLSLGSYSLWLVIPALTLFTYILFRFLSLRHIG